MADDDKVDELIVGHLEKTIDRQVNRFGQLTAFSVGLIAVSLTISAFSLQQVENLTRDLQGLNFPRNLRVYELWLLWQAASISMLWAILAIWRSLLRSVPAITKPELYDTKATGMVPLLQLFREDLERIRAYNEEKYHARLARFAVAQGLVCSGIFASALAVFRGFAFSALVPGWISYGVATGLILLLALEVNQQVNREDFKIRLIDLWLAPVLIGLTFAIGPALLIHFAPDVFHALPEEDVILSVAVAFVALWTLSRRQAIPGWLKAAYQASRIERVLHVLRDWRLSEASRSSKTNKALARHILEDIIGQGEWKLIDELIAAEVTLHFSSVVMYEVKGRNALQKIARTCRATLPDLRLRIEDQIADSDRVATRFIAEGTYKGDSANVPKDTRVTVAGLIIQSFQEGQLVDGCVLVEGQVTDDQHGFLQQLGMLPSAAPRDGSSQAGGQI